MAQKYRVVLGDGRTFEVESEGGPPTEADVYAHLDTMAASPNEQLKAANAKPLKEPTTYTGGVIRSVGDTIGKTVKGVAEGAAGLVDPRNYIAPIRAAGLVLSDPGQAAVNAAIQSQGLLDEGKRIVAGDPEAGGRAIGALAGGAVLPSALSFAKGRVSGVSLPPSVLKVGPMARKAAELATKHGATAAGAAMSGPAGAIVGSKIGDALAGAVRGVKATPTAAMIEEQLGLSPAGNTAAHMASFPETAAPVRSRLPIPVEPAVTPIPKEIRTSGAKSFEDVARELGLDPARLKAEAAPMPSRVATPGPTPFEQMAAEGQFAGDRTTGHFVEGPGGLSSITPEEIAKMGSASGVASDVLPSMGESADAVVARALRGGGRYGPNAEPLPLPGVAGLTPEQAREALVNELLRRESFAKLDAGTRKRGGVYSKSK